MKKLNKLSAVVATLAFSATSFAQLQDEKNVTITMDLQPILQLKMEGPDQLDFTFDEINEYYAGITKYGATILKVSGTVSWDLWAAGLSQAQEGNFLWDNPIEYQAATGSTDNLPITALELHQFPANPAIAAGCGTVVAASSDYNAAFQPVTAPSTSTMVTNNSVYCPNPTTPYTSPTSTAVAATSEKYIAGGTGTGANCSIVGGSYLIAGGLTSNYYYVLDYRIMPNLPVTFPSHLTANATNGGAAYVTNADGATTLTAAGTVYAQPGVYTMYVKYILAQDQ